MLARALAGGTLAGADVKSYWGLRVCTISEIMRLRPSADLHIQRKLNVMQLSRELQIAVLFRLWVGKFEALAPSSTCDKPSDRATRGRGDSYSEL